MRDLRIDLYKLVVIVLHYKFLRASLNWANLFYTKSHLYKPELASKFYESISILLLFS
jgi:hypothetical protein